MDIWNVIADRKIREAMEEGAFENLSGTGRPLNLEEDLAVDPSMRMAYRVLRNNGLAPDWIMESKEIDAEIARVAECEPAARRERVEALNRRIAVYNLKAPRGAQHRLPIKP